MAWLNSGPHELVASTSSTKPSISPAWQIFISYLIYVRHIHLILATKFSCFPSICPSINPLVICWFLKCLWFSAQCRHTHLWGWAFPSKNEFPSQENGCLGKSPKHSVLVLLHRPDWNHLLNSYCIPVLSKHYCYLNLWLSHHYFKQGHCGCPCFVDVFLWPRPILPSSLHTAHSSSLGSVICKMRLVPGDRLSSRMEKGVSLGLSRLMRVLLPQRWVELLQRRAVGPWKKEIFGLLGKACMKLWRMYTWHPNFGAARMVSWSEGTEWLFSY